MICGDRLGRSRLCINISHLCRLLNWRRCCGRPSSARPLQTSPVGPPRGSRTRFSRRCRAADLASTSSSARDVSGGQLFFQKQVLLFFESGFPPHPLQTIVSQPEFFAGVVATAGGRPWPVSPNQGGVDLPLLSPSLVAWQASFSSLPFRTGAARGRGVTGGVGAPAAVVTARWRRPPAPIKATTPPSTSRTLLPR